MTARQTKRPSKYEADPLVPLVPERLRAAMDVGGWTPASLRTRMGSDENRQTLHHLLKAEDPLKCRRERRRQLARILEVPDGWLGGGEIRLPATGLGRLLDVHRRSPRFALSAARLMLRCDKACARDLARYRAEPEEKTPWPASDDVLYFLAGAVGRFGTPGEWQRTLLIQSNTPRQLTQLERRRLVSGQLLDMPVPYSEEEEQAALGLLRALRFILTPWFQDRAALDYEKFRLLITAIAGSPGPFPPESERPDVIVSNDGRQLQLDDPSTPFALVVWPSPTNPVKRGRNESPR